jgi:mannan endo-1,4-beta-mannosidase
MKILFLLALFILFTVAGEALGKGFVEVKGHELRRNGKQYFFVGTNYWYGGLLGLEKDRKRGIDRLRRELDFLKANGVKNLRLMAGAEGSGLLNGVFRVGPPLQPERGRFDEGVLRGLDTVLAEMAKRDMTAVIFFSNNWEWSGGFQQYLIWNGVISSEWLTRKPSWDELRDLVAKFYSCRACVEDYNKQLRLVVERRNSVTGKLYTADPTIMAWELANEPRPMRPAANDDYKKWIRETSDLIRSLDKRHLITTGHEGWIGTQDIALFEALHAFPNVDYITIHIWPKNWGWFADKRLAEEFPNAVAETEKYINDNLTVARKLNKPMVIEEFGLPRDRQSFSPSSTTHFRDQYYTKVFRFLDDQPAGRRHVAGANFWAFGGTARPRSGQVFWKLGDEFMGDPPMEEQGLNTVFDSDKTTWSVIGKTAQRISMYR